MAIVAAVTRFLVVCALLALVIPSALAAAPSFNAADAVQPTFLPLLADEVVLTSLVIVESVAGDDASCAPLVLAQTTPADTAVLPCRTLSRALALVDGLGYWILVRPGVHFGSSLTIEHSQLTISSDTPLVPPGGTFVIPSATTSGPVVWNCEGASQCVRLAASATTILFRGIEFVNATGHAIIQPDDVTSYPESILTIFVCTFTGVGGAVKKEGGSLVFLSSTVQHCTTFPNDPAFNSSNSLIQLNDAHLAVAASTFNNNSFVGDYMRLGGCIGANSFRLPRSMRVQTSFFTKNHKFSLYEYTNIQISYAQTTGGIGLLVNASFADISIVDTSFINNTVLATCSGIAVSVITSPLLAINQVSVVITGSVFEGNVQANPEPTNTDWFYGFGGIVAIKNTAEYITAITPQFFSGPSILVNDTRFEANEVYGCAGILLREVRLMNLNRVDFISLRGHSLSVALRTFNSPPSFPTVPWTMDSCNIIGASSDAIMVNSQGAVRFENCPLSLTVSNCFFEGGHFSGAGGGLIFATIGTLATTIGRIELIDSTFRGNYAYNGAGVTLTSVTAKIRRCTFDGNSASSGAALFITASRVQMNDCSFSNHHLKPIVIPPEDESTFTLSQIVEGGALAISGGSTSIIDCTFFNNSAVPEGGVEACHAYDTGTTVLTSSYLAGAISSRTSDIDISGCTFTEHSACSGGAVLIAGSGLNSYFNDFANSYAWRGGSYAVVNAMLVNIQYHTFSGSSAISNGGTLLVLSTTQVFFIANSIMQSTSETDDGGAIWSEQSAGSMPINVISSDFTACSTPMGGGGVLYRTASPTGTQALIDITDPELENIFVDDPDSFYGPYQASNVVSLQPSIARIEIYPGALIPTLHIAALDVYNATVKGSRGLVVQAEAAMVSTSPEIVQGPTLFGTILQQMTFSSVVASFWDLVVEVEPGEYELVFSLIGQKAVPDVHVPLIILATCPAGLWYSMSERICRDCGADILVYDVVSGKCSPCPAGWEVASVGAERVCHVCPAGKTSSVGGLCTACGSNTYQPAPGLPCKSCLDGGMQGLQCANDLPEVSEGWFAFSVTAEDGSVKIHTAQCPDGFCSGAVVQSEWADPISLVNQSSVSTAPAFASAITRFDQCKFPRRSSEDNLLCGKCVPGYIPWGDKCTKCDHPNGGMVFLLLILSILLVLFLLRSASLSSSAGHSVIVLYFVQTAMLEVGSAGNLIGWLNITLFSPNSTSQCIAPLTVYEQATFQIVMPLILFGELICVGGVHVLLSRYFSVADIRSVDLPPTATLVQRVKNELIRFIADCSIDLYISATLTLLLFSYTQVTVACLSYLVCVDVGDVSVVFTQPSMRCASSEYKQYLGLVVFALITYVIAFPIGVLTFLWRRYTLVVAAHEHMEAIESAAAPNKENESDPTKPAPSHLNTSAATLHFLRRYSPLFSMYSSRAWFWQVLVLVRRTIFVTFSVALVRDPASKFLAYSLTHFVSLQLQLYFRPFSIDFFNRAEIVSHFLLILLSQTLTAVLPPYAQSIEVFLFFLVVPPVGFYAILAACLKYSSVRAVSAAEFDAALEKHEQREAEVIDEINSRRGTTVEMGDIAIGTTTNDPEVMASPLQSPFFARHQRLSEARGSGPLPPQLLSDEAAL